MKNENINNIMGSEIEMFWELVGAYWQHEEREYGLDVVQAVEDAWEEEEIKGLHHGQEEKEEDICHKQEILEEIKVVRRQISTLTKKAWGILGYQDRKDLTWAIKGINDAWKKMISCLSDEILALDNEYAANAQDHVLYKGSEKQTFMDALEGGFLDALSLDKLIVLIEYVDTEVPFLTFNEKKMVKLGCYARLHKGAPEGEWKSDYENLLKWWRNYQKEESQTVEIDAHGHVPFSSEDEIIHQIDAARTASSLFKSLYRRFRYEGLSKQRAEMEASVVALLQAC